MAKRPSILGILTDHTSAAAVASPDCRTPNLDALAARGVRFAEAYAPAPLTLPSHAAILTGTDPHVNGVMYQDGANKWNPRVFIDAEALALDGDDIWIEKNGTYNHIGPNHADATKLTEDVDTILTVGTNWYKCCGLRYDSRGHLEAAYIGPAKDANPAAYTWTNWPW